MNKFKIFMDNILIICGVIYLWLFHVLLYKNIIEYKPYQLALAILFLGIYLGYKIDNLKK